MCLNLLKVVLLLWGEHKTRVKSFYIYISKTLNWIKEMMPPIEIVEKKSNLYFSLCWSILLAVYAIWVIVRPYSLPTPMNLFPILFSLMQIDGLHRLGLKKWIFISIIVILFYTLIFIGQDDPSPDKPVAFMKYGVTILFLVLILAVSTILIVISVLALIKNKSVLIIDSVGIKFNAAFMDFTIEIKWVDIKDVCQSVNPKYGVIELNFNNPLFLKEKISKETSLLRRWAASKLLITDGSRLCIATKRLSVPYETLLPIIKDYVKTSEVINSLH